MMQSESSVHITVKGTVQGIGYRWFVQKTAYQFALHGWVRNVPNGDVEIEAYGHKDRIEAFIEHIRTEHPWASIHDITVQWLDTIKKYSAFEILL